MFGRASVMRELFARLEKLAASDATVLITGETGVGKELVAESLHEYSPRAEGPFVVLDCGSIPQNLIESELFGHERGAFTGAVSSYAGAFERAHRGTCSSTRSASCRSRMQPKLLRALERKEVRRIGGRDHPGRHPRGRRDQPRPRGRGQPRPLPRGPLLPARRGARARAAAARAQEDIELLIEHFLAITPNARAPTRAETVELMKKHDWPGNVRELRNVIERRAPPQRARPMRIRALRRPRRGRCRGAGASRRDGPVARRSSDEVMAVPIDTRIPFKIAKQALVTEFERRYIRRLLAEHGGNISAAAGRRHRPDVDPQDAPPARHRQSGPRRPVAGRLRVTPLHRRVFLMETPPFQPIWPVINVR
jgi:DNA-binding NtrC family response regulator